MASTEMEAVSAIKDTSAIRAISDITEYDADVDENDLDAHEELNGFELAFKAKDAVAA